jgi:hypothetical protein
MTKPDLPHVARWIDSALVVSLEQRRREKKEWLADAKWEKKAAACRI